MTQRDLQLIADWLGQVSAWETGGAEQNSDGHHRYKQVEPAAEGEYVSMEYYSSADFQVYAAFMPPAHRLNLAP